MVLNFKEFWTLNGRINCSKCIRIYSDLLNPRKIAVFTEPLILKWDQSLTEKFAQKSVVFSSQIEI